MKMIANKQCRLIVGGSGLLGPADPFSEGRKIRQVMLVIDSNHRAASPNKNS
ncbi:hypothetical protein [Pseudoalteromonas umbrosa]|uniref:hypothetical protein n=1 Tax=Pseudoalteromonas umbrosa TaxID=3048489 RepID=UPI0024C33988|nr:hypothetical protein [Pseudoalteromonas sp. B95]MDK1289483.1 hypothetical protein [Pseudoalteromonas sp. B95]